MRRFNILILSFFIILIPFISHAATGDITLPLCSSSIHDSYHVTGPDGVQYPSWHPQVDHYENCRFDHEHGSNPAFLAPVSWPYGTSMVPAFGYSAAKHGMTEGHAGFKVHVFRLAGYIWMITHHFGTSSPNIAACVRYHTFDLVIVDDDQDVQANLHLMGDFGKAVSNDVDAGFPPLTPTACPIQAVDSDASGSNGVREFPVLPNPVAYEPWRLDSHELSAVGFRSGGFTINTGDPQRACDTLTCTTTTQMNTLPGEASRGAWRFDTFNDAGGGLRVSGVISGTFYTDPTGNQSRTSTASDAVRQYIRPGFSISVGPQEHCRVATGSAIEMMYWCSAVLPDQLTPKLNRFVTGAN